MQTNVSENNFDLTNNEIYAMQIRAISPIRSGTIREAANGPSRTVPLTTQQRLIGAYSLPLPENLTWTSELDWSPDDRNIVQNVFGNFDKASKEFSENTGAFVGNLAKRFAGSTLDAFGSKSVLARNGESVDPLKEVFFNGVSNRTYEWQWKLYPKNLDEAIAYRDAIISINRSAHPEKAEAGIYKIPDHFNVEFVGLPSQTLPTIKNGVITNISSNVTEGGAPRFTRDGHPSFVSLSITMVELEVPTKEDFQTRSVG